MKTKEELNALKEEFKALNEKLNELTEEELTQVNGGMGMKVSPGHKPCRAYRPKDKSKPGCCGNCFYFSPCSSECNHDM